MQSPDCTEYDAKDHVSLRDGRCPTIAEHATQCNSLFHQGMLMPGIVPHRFSYIIEDQRTRFAGWAEDLDVHGPPNASLDYKLRFSPIIVESIHGHLDTICYILTLLKPSHDRPQGPAMKRRRISEHGDSQVKRGADDNASDSKRDTDRAEQNISMIRNAIGENVTKLLDLSRTIRDSAETGRAIEMDRRRDDEEAKNAIGELRGYTECYIRLRFPRAPDLLRSALVEANAVRLGRLLHRRRHPRRIDLTVENPQTTPDVAQPAETEESAPGVLPERATINETSGPASPPPVLVTNETVVRASSAEPAAEVPPSPSIIVDNISAFPPKPRTNECPYCGVIMEFGRTAEWHHHFVEDLEPFICVFAPCLEDSQHGTGPPRFGTMEAWISHMQNAHADITAFHQEMEYREHVIKEHAVPEEYIGTIANAARRPIIAKKLERCPFGDNFQHPEESESSDVFSSKALEIHVVAHMEEVALLTLRKLPDDGDGNSEEVDGDQTRQGDGSGVVTFREVIQSILEYEGYDL